ncbi:MAG: DUF4350 domain-containing protein [Steroidobacteraceae bacterium]
MNTSATRMASVLAALAAALLFFLMFLLPRSPERAREAISRPVSSESRSNGYLLLQRWLQDSGFEVRALRSPYTSLGEIAGADHGNLLLVTLPGARPIRTDEQLALERWLRNGNTLVVMAALTDAPDWSQAFGGVALADIAALTGLDFESTTQRESRLAGRRTVRPAPSVELLARPQERRMVPRQPHPLFDRVGAVAGVADYTQQDWLLRVPFDSFAAELAADSGSGIGTAFVKLVGKGKILLLTMGSPLTNRAIERADNARFAANLFAANVAPAGVVIFDDAHQGVADTYDAASFYADPRLYLSILVLLLTWFSWVVGGTALVLPVRIEAPAQADLLNASAAFLARVVRPADAAVTLVQQFVRSVSTRLRLAPDPQSFWQWLARHPRVASADLARVSSMARTAGSGGKVDLLRLRNLLVKIDRQIP